MSGIIHRGTGQLLHRPQITFESEGNLCCVVMLLREEGFQLLSALARRMSERLD